VKIAENDVIRLIGVRGIITNGKKMLTVKDLFDENGVSGNYEENFDGTFPASEMIANVNNTIPISRSNNNDGTAITGD
jgi:hypothetical protein